MAVDNQSIFEKEKILPEKQIGGFEVNKSEKIKTQEQTAEKMSSEAEQDKIEKIIKPNTSAKGQKIVIGQRTLSPLQKSIEDALSKDLDEIYFNLDKDTQIEFKSEGEKVASEIEKLIKSLQITAKKVLDLIIGWLKIIPGTSKHFLDQEAKLKTDEIMKMTDDFKV